MSDSAKVAVSLVIGAILGLLLWPVANAVRNVNPNDVHSMGGGGQDGKQHPFDDVSPPIIISDGSIMFIGFGSWTTKGQSEVFNDSSNEQNKSFKVSVSSDGASCTPDYEFATDSLDLVGAKTGSPDDTYLLDINGSGKIRITSKPGKSHAHGGGRADFGDPGWTLKSLTDHKSPTESCTFSHTTHPFAILRPF